jgi:hypothetical protein
MDKLWSESNFDGMRELISDSAQFVWQNGISQNPDEFIEALKADTLNYSWSFDWAFSVKDDNSDGKNQWVNAGFNGTVNDSEGNALESAHYNEWYLINEDGKVAFWYNLKADR